MREAVTAGGFDRHRVIWKLNRNFDDSLIDGFQYTGVGSELENLNFSTEEFHRIVYLDIFVKLEVPL